MLISSQLFDRIVGTNKNAELDFHQKSAVLPVGCRRATERRTTVRISFGQRTLISCDRGPKAGAWETVMIQDISLSGIGFLCHEAMAKGDTFIMKVTARDEQIIRIRCAIQRCERGGYGGVGYLLGATFEQVIQNQVVRINDDEGQVTQSWALQTTSVNAEVAQLPHANGLRRAAVTFFKSLDPSHWLRKSDDYSSVG